MKHGLIKTAAAICDTVNGDIESNTKRIISLIGKAARQKVELLCFAELTLTGVEIGDLVVFADFLAEAEAALGKVIDATKGKNMICCVGLPLRVESKIFNVTAVLFEGEVVGVVPKTSLTGAERFFSAATAEDNFDVEIAGHDAVFTPNLIVRNVSADDFAIAFEAGAGYSDAVPPSSLHAMAGANIIVCPSARTESAGGHAKTVARLMHSSAHLRAAFVYVNASGAHSRASYSGSAAITENGTLLVENRPYATREGLIVTDIDCEFLNNLRLKKPLDEVDTDSYEDFYIPFNHGTPALTRQYSKAPFVDDILPHLDEIDDIVCDAIYRRMVSSKADKLLVGLSGGLDSTMALIFAHNACVKHKIDTRKVLAVTMPSVPTSSRTYENAHKLARELGVSFLDINIEKAFKSQLAEIKHTGIEDIAYENAQARLRTQFLLNLGNKDNGIMLGTCDMSEFALGWATFGGDHICHFNPNNNITKTQIRALIKHIAGKAKNRALAEVLFDIVDTPISPELKSDQKTEDTIGPYPLIDFFIYHYLFKAQSEQKTLFLAEAAFGEDYKGEFLEKCLKNFIRRFRANSFKRNCSPDSPTVQEFNISEIYLPSVN